MTDFTIRAIIDLLLGFSGFFCGYQCRDYLVRKSLKSKPSTEDQHSND